MAGATRLAGAPEADGEARASPPPRVLDLGLFLTPIQDRLAGAAAARGLPLAGFGGIEAPGEASPGDMVCGLVTWFEPEVQAQWLVTLALKEADAAPPAAPPDPLVLHSSSGRSFTFSTATAAVDVCTLGPTERPSRDGRETAGPVRAVEAEARVAREFLLLGLAGACRAVERLRLARAEGRVGRDERLSIAGRPHPPEVVAAGGDLVTRAGLTAADERAFAATMPALLGYTSLIAKTPGPRDILRKVIARPSLWSILRRVGRIESTLDFEARSVAPLDPAVVGLPAGMAVYQLPFTLMLNGQPGLECMLVVTEPRPPLSTSAGIVGLIASRPSDPDRRVVIRLLGSRRGAVPPRPGASTASVRSRPAGSLGPPPMAALP